MKFTEFFEQTYGPTLSQRVAITYRDDPADTNNLGPLSGVDLDSDLYSGYIYFWGNGHLDFMVYNLTEDKDEIPITIVDTKDYRQDEILAKILKFFR